MALPSPTHAHTVTPQPNEQIEEIAKERPTDPRGKERTFASFPEWYIVYSAQEYSDFVANNGRPSQFPYFKSISQYWDSIQYVREALGGTEIDSNTNTVLRFIGASFTFENLVIGCYEKTLGYISEASNAFRKSRADRYIDGVSKEYSEFLLHTPWYDFPYFQKLPGLWSGFLSDFSIRGMERRTIFTVGYVLKGIYGKVIGSISHSSLGFAELRTRFTTDHISKRTLQAIPNVTIEEVYTDGHIRASAPRYRAFTPTAETIVNTGGSLVDIQEHDKIMLTVIAPEDSTCIHTRDDLLFSMPIVTQQHTSRFALTAPVQQLHTTIQELASCKIKLEHIYDY